MDESQIKKELSMRIKAYRKSERLSQDEFGALIGFEQKNVSRLESGKSMPDTKTVCKLIEAGISPEYLFAFLTSKSSQCAVIDYEIINLLVDFPIEAKESIKTFLKSIKKK